MSNTFGDNSSDGSAPDVLVTWRRLRNLLCAQEVVAGDLGLQPVLQHVVTAARELVEARYAALGVIGEHGVLDEFVHVGMDEAAGERIAEPPRGHGILGLLISHPVPVRLSDLTTHPAAAGFPPHHPDMTSFLGVPIRVRGRVFGSLYLAGSANGQFSADDEQLAVALAATAGMAIDNARLRDESEQRRQWLTVSTEVTCQLFAAEGDDPLDVILRAARQTAAVDFAAVALVAEPGPLRVHATIGVLSDRVLIAEENSAAGRVALSGTPVLIATAPGKGSVVVVPLLDGDKIMGTLGVGRLAGRRPLTATDLHHLAGFARHAGAAMELSRVRAVRQAQRISDVHDRIGIELNNRVIRDLFAVSLGLQGLGATARYPVLRTRLNDYVDILDSAISRIRTAVYDADVVPGRRPPGLNQRILAAVDDHTHALGFPVTTTFHGHFGRAMPSALADTVVAVVCAALTAVAGHLNATRAELRVGVDDDLVTVENIDNGTYSGLPTARADAPAGACCRSGHRAGELKHTTTSDGDTRLTWSTRIPRPPSRHPPGTPVG